MYGAPSYLINWEGGATLGYTSHLRLSLGVRMRGKSLDKDKENGREKNRKEGMKEKGKHEMLVLKSDYSSVEHLI